MGYRINAGSQGTRTREGLKAVSGNIRVGEVAKQIIRIAADGLTRRSTWLGIDDESVYLEPVREIVETGITQAEHHLQNYYETWGEDVRELVRRWPKLRCSCECI